ncbi:MAG TPA: NUDIX domain-containing protein [Oscillospiraceae bacterium]|nr:NUDIX domain-containing protein [Oscillospiraceae bacterium]
MLGKKYSDIKNDKDYNVKKYGNISENSVVSAVYKNILVIADESEKLFEPFAKKFLGISQKEKVKCLYEKTCGSVMFTYKGNERLYLLIKNESGHIGFPKGHIELDESEEQTAVREVFEETGIKANLIDNLRMEYQYITHDNTHKTCVYFMSEYPYRKAEIQESEISQSWLVGFDEAVELLNFPQDRVILDAVEKRLRHEKS